MWVTYIENSSEHGPFWKNEDYSFTLNNESENEESNLKELDINKIGLKLEDLYLFYNKKQMGEDEEKRKKKDNLENIKFIEGFFLI
jgi:hypothetical protein